MIFSRPLHFLSLVFGRIVSEIRYFPLRVRAFRLDASTPRGYYNYFDRDKLSQRCRGDTLFVLGSGASLAQLPDELISKMHESTTMSLNYSLLQSFIPTDFHVVRELGAANDEAIDIQKSELKKLGTLIGANPQYRETVFLVQGGFYAWAANLFIGWLCLPHGAKIFRFRNSPLPIFRSLSNSFESIIHGASTITDCINLGYLMGFKKIVLCGVDLYDRRYFWHIDNASHLRLDGITDAKLGEYGGNGKVSERHRAAKRLISQIASWQQELKVKGVKLFVQNPRSLLAEILPIYNLDLLENSCKSFKSNVSKI